VREARGGESILNVTRQIRTIRDEQRANQCGIIAKYCIDRATCARAHSAQCAWFTHDSDVCSLDQNAARRLLHVAANRYETSGGRVPAANCDADARVAALDSPAQKRSGRHRVFDDDEEWLPTHTIACTRLLRPARFSRRDHSGRRQRGKRKPDDASTSSAEGCARNHGTSDEWKIVGEPRIEAGKIDRERMRNERHAQTVAPRTPRAVTILLRVKSTLR
jgi:hypothetical protein